MRMRPQRGEFGGARHTGAAKLRSLKPTYIELFSGAGLLGLGFKSAGFAPVRAYEYDANAAATCARNVCADTKQADLAAERPEGKCQVLLAGPPCQGFSSMPKSPRKRGFGD